MYWFSTWQSGLANPGQIRDLFVERDRAQQVLKLSAPALAHQDRTAERGTMCGLRTSWEKTLGLEAVEPVTMGHRLNLCESKGFPVMSQCGWLGASANNGAEGAVKKNPFAIYYAGCYVWGREMCEDIEHRHSEPGRKKWYCCAPHAVRQWSVQHFVALSHLYSLKQ